MAAKTENERAILYRDNNDARIRYRHAQLAGLQGSHAAFVALWDNYRVVYDKTNYIEGQPEESFMAIEDFYTDGQKDYGSLSGSTVRLPHVRRLSTP